MWNARGVTRHDNARACKPAWAGRAVRLYLLLVGLLLTGSAGPVAAAGLGDMLGALAGSPGEYGRGRDLDDALRRLASQINRGTPRNINEEFRLDQVTTGPGPELSYHYTMLGRRASELRADVLNTRMAPAILKRLCTDAQMQKLLDSGVAVSFAYRGNDGGNIGKLSFRERDCVSKG